MTCCFLASLYLHGILLHLLLFHLSLKLFWNPSAFTHTRAHTHTPFFPCVLKNMIHASITALTHPNWNYLSDFFFPLTKWKCPTLYNHKDYSPCQWNSPGKNTGVGSHSLLQIFSTEPRDWIQVSCIAGRFFTI